VDWTTKWSRLWLSIPLSDIHWWTKILLSLRGHQNCLTLGCMPLLRKLWTCQSECLTAQQLKGIIKIRCWWNDKGELLCFSAGNSKNNCHFMGVSVNDWMSADNCCYIYVKVIKPCLPPSPWTKSGSIIFSLKTTHTKCNTITNIWQHQRSSRLQLLMTKSCSLLSGWSEFRIYAYWCHHKFWGLHWSAAKTEDNIQIKHFILICTRLSLNTTLWGFTWVHKILHRFTALFHYLGLPTLHPKLSSTCLWSLPNTEGTYERTSLLVRQ
jgi:hypothetical protein